MNIFEKIYKIISLIPKGKVMTYKQIADILGIKNPQIVGFALHQNKNPEKIPCHRIVKNNGSLAKGYVFGGKKEQKRKLKEDGVIFLENGKIDFEEHLFNFLKKHKLIDFFQ